MESTWLAPPLCLLSSSLRLSASARERLSHDLAGQAKRGSSRRDAVARRGFGLVVTEGFVESTVELLPPPPVFSGILCGSAPLRENARLMIHRTSEEGDPRAETQRRGGGSDWW